MKILFIASTGGHLEELLQLSDLLAKSDSWVVTEKTKSTLHLKAGKHPVSFLVFGTKDHWLVYPFKFLYNCIRSLILYLRIKPDAIITTGTHTAVPMCYWGKLLGAKIIYIETFANITTKTLSGRLVYPIADLFIVQWHSMQELYPKAVVGGWIF
ncbi:MAG: polysaccharide biosynthesis protein [Erysipelotrichaceae bacterium]|jgi:UDP-N-acetylglucosamine:LPS N-acetylglucosamine transferase|nr:polysaccharide biosynthesis protein [Erysipelotrichaceae bacterium]